MSNVSPGRDCQASIVCASVTGTKPRSTVSKYRVCLEQPNWPSSGVCAAEKQQKKARKMKTQDDFNMVPKKLTLANREALLNITSVLLRRKGLQKKKAAPKGRLERKYEHHQTLQAFS